MYTEFNIKRDAKASLFLSFAVYIPGGCDIIIIERVVKIRR
jgi:hypothetical protein